MKHGDPTLKITLEDGTGTWVTVAPIEGWTLMAVYRALQEASQGFRDGICRDEASVERHLREAVARGIKAEA